jgi:hypothetical protein
MPRITMGWRGVWGLLLCLGPLLAGATEKVVDLPTRPGVTQRLLVDAPAQPQGVAILFAGGHGGLQIAADGQLGWGRGNFLVRSRALWGQKDWVTVLVDAPSDRQGSGFLSGFRQTPEHQADITAVMQWLRSQYVLPIWLVGTSRGTQSVGFLATELGGPARPDGIALTATILQDPRGRAVPAMPLQNLRMPVLVVHHEDDACKHCRFSDMPALMTRLEAVPTRQLMTFTGGADRGDPCEAMAHHGFNGLEADVVAKMSAWMRSARR